MDFITDLLKLKNLVIKLLYDVIWVIVDRFDNKLICLLFRKNYDL